MATTIKLDILVLAAHPDDAELGCGGTMIKHIKQGKKVGVVDFTRGELGTRGTSQTRSQEAANAAKILGLTVRENLNLPDGFFKNDKDHQMVVVQAIRKFRPDIVLSNAVTDRHPDHGRGAALAFEACFLSGLAKIETAVDGSKQEHWRPKAVYHFIQSQFIKPDFVVDISEEWDQKMEAVKAFKTQFFDPGSKEPETYISRQGFLKLLESRATEMGIAIDVRYGEGFTTPKWIGIKSLYDIF